MRFSNIVMPESNMQHYHLKVYCIEFKGIYDEIEISVTFLKFENFFTYDLFITRFIPSMGPNKMRKNISFRFQ